MYLIRKLLSIYYKTAVVASVAVTGTNAITPLIMKDYIEDYSPNFIENYKKYPQLVFTACLLKGCVLGALWPIIPFELYNDYKDVILLGHEYKRILKYNR